MFLGLGANFLFQVKMVFSENTMNKVKHLFDPAGNILLSIPK